MFNMPLVMTPSDDPLDAILDTYKVEIDGSDITVDTMTDCGIPVGQLKPIGDCSLTPGNPSPVGRTVEGDLAYAVLENEEFVQMTRAEAAHLAHLFIKAHAAHDLTQEGQRLLARLVDAAAPKPLFPDTAHGALAWEHAVGDVHSAGTSRFGKPFGPVL